MKANRSFIFSLIALVCSILVAGSAVFAWFAQNNDVRGGVSIDTITEPDAGIVITSVNDSRDFVRDLTIYPGDSLLIELKAISDDVFLGELGLTYVVKPLTVTPGAFENAFQNREDLLNGQYAVEQQLAGGQTVYNEFDIQAHLDGLNLTAAQKKSAKLEFLKLFAEQNRMGLAFSATVVFAYEMELGEASEHYVLAKSENNNDTYAVMDSQIFMFIDERIKIQVNFGEEYIEERYVYKYRDYVPKITVTNENNLGIFPNGTYTAQNLNCFMFQTVQLIFSKITL